MIELPLGFKRIIMQTRNKNTKRKPTQNQSSNRRPKNNSKKSSLDPRKLIQTAAPVKLIKSETREFSSLPIDSAIYRNIQQMGFVSMTEIQDRTFTELLEGRDLIGIANTGTGKTAAFLIPTMQRLLSSPKKFQTLVVVPTRELALQVMDEFKKLSNGLGLKAACFIGGTNIESDRKQLIKTNDFIVATPGRLLDLKQRGYVRLENVEVLVLDEFDKMLDMGFIRDIRSIVDALRNRKQTLLFSATKDPKQTKLISEFVMDPFVVEVSTGDTSSKNVEQDIIRVNEGQDKFQLLLDLLKKADCEKAILFTETKHLANRLSKKLNSSGIKSDQIHGNKSQNYRVNALEKFRKGSIQVLVATDVAARGIDINNVTHVINYQMPRDFDTYIHRVGRTGRAGKTGNAYTFVD